VIIFDAVSAVSAWSLS